MQISSEEIPEDSPNYLKTSTRLSRSLAFPRSSAAETRNIRTDLCAQNASENRGTLTFFFFFFFIPPPHYSTRVRVWRGGYPVLLAGIIYSFNYSFLWIILFFFFPFLRTFFFTFFFVFFLAFFFIYIFFKSMIVIDTCQNYSTTWIVHYKHNNYYKITDFYWCSL